MLYLDIPTREQLSRMAATRSDAAVTIYLKTTPLTQDIEKARISLKNLRKEAVDQLQAAGVEKRRIWPIEEKIEALEEDDDFWVTQAHSLAIFVTPERIRHFRLANRLERSVHVSDRFHMKPLLRATTFSNSAYILALAEDSIRLIDVTAEGEANIVKVADMPKSVSDALGKSTLNDRAHSRRAAGDEGKNLRLRQFVRMVDKAVMGAIRTSDRPLILAAADPLENFYRGHCAYDHLAPKAIEGNPEHKSEAELSEAARPIITELQQEEIAELRDLYGARQSDGRASSDLSTVARAAAQGAIETLLVDMEVEIHGTLADDGSLTLAETPGAGTYGVADAIAMQAMHMGARVVAVRKDDLPDANAALSAILRYAV